MRRPLLGFIVTSILFSQGLAKEVKLKWKGIAGAKKYNVEVSSTDDFQKTSFSKSLKEASTTADLKSGIYFMRVQGVDVLDRPGHWSRPFKLVVTAPVKALQEMKTPKKITYMEKTPDVQTQWKPLEAASGFKVTVEKNGKEFLTKETTNPEIDFHPTEPGEYKVFVSSGMGRYYGKRVAVSHVQVEKNTLRPPEWKMSDELKFTARKPIKFKWSEVEGARFYRLKIYKVEGERGPASETPTQVVSKINDNEYEAQRLPPGRYFASVESRESETLAAPSTKYFFDVKRGKPVEFERIDLYARYGLTPVNYYISLTEAGRAPTSTSSVGGAGLIEGTLWLPDSSFGFRTSGTWGGFVINTKSISYNDLQLLGVYRFKALGLQFKPVLGARAWTMPLVMNSNDPSLGSDPNTIMVFTPTLMGPTAGLELTVPLSEKWALSSRSQITVPVGNSTFGGGSIANIKADPTINPKLELGLKFAFAPGLRAVAMGGFQSDTFRWSSVSGGSNSAAPNGSKSYITTDVVSASLGIESTDDLGYVDSSEGASSSHVARKDRFSEFNLLSRYIFYSPLSYKSERTYNPSNAPSFTASSAGSVEFEGSGWLKDSIHGVRFMLAWGGLTFNGATVSYPESALQWGLKPRIFSKNSAFELKNYLGLRTWQVPIISLDGNNSGNNSGGNNGGGSSSSSSSSSNTYFSAAPQLLGLAETLRFNMGLGQNWFAGVEGEISAPVTTVSSDSTVSRIEPLAISYRFESDLTRKFSEDLSASVSFGYRLNQLRYFATTSDNSSYSSLSGPALALGLTYSF